jgi:LPS export ABC transporter protein LptC
VLSLHLLPLLAGCRGEQVAPDDSVPPFIFRSLNLRQQDLLGRPSWELTSPEARYDVRRRLARAKDPRGVIHAKGKPVYRLEATSGTVVNDGEVILLEGAVKVRRLGKQPVLITASRVRWIPSKQVMEIDRHPRALDGRSLLVSRRARFLIDRDQLELRGQPRLERWSRPFDPFRGRPKGPPQSIVTVTRADWGPGTGKLKAAGPVRGRRTPEGRPQGRPPQLLTASALEGNTRTQKYVLKPPVRFDDPVERIELRAQEVEINAGREYIRTVEPFDGRIGDLTASGRSAVVDGGRDTATIEGDCALDRPGESLRAERCEWNWETQDVEAEGSMEFRREANRQLTRGHQVRGRLGDEGRLTVTTPGGRVFSEFRLPPGSGPSRPPSKRQEPEPIRL